MKFTFFAALCFISTSSFAADQSLADKLVAVLKYRDVVDSATESCVETARKTDVEAELARTPGLFGGITPESPLWVATRHAYVTYLEASCNAFSKDKAAAAVTREYADRLSNSEIEAVLAFYATAAGQRFRDAGVFANNAGNREASDSARSKQAYDDYNHAIELLIRQHVQAADTPGSSGAR